MNYCPTHYNVLNVVIFGAIVTECMPLHVKKYVYFGVAGCYAAMYRCM